MLKRRSKHFALLLVLTMLATMFVGVGTASAASINKVVGAVANVSDVANGVALASIQIDEDIVGNIAVGDVFSLTIKASGVEWPAAPATINFTGTDGIAATWTRVTSKVANVEVTAIGAARADGAIIKITNTVNVTSTGSGDIAINVAAPGTAITEGDYVVGKFVTGGASVSALSTPSKGAGNQTLGSIRVIENSATAIANTETLTVKLPTGMSWQNAAFNVTGTNGRVLTGATSGRTLTLTFPATAATVGIYDIPTAINIDKSEASKGDITASIGGSSDVSGDVVIGKYADYSASVSVKSVKELKAGKFEVKTDEITIEENIAGTFIDDRSFTIQLPSWVKVTEVIQVSDSFGIDESVVPAADAKDHADLTITTPTTTTAGKYKFKLELSIQADKTGDIEAVFSGAGMEETKAVIAKAIAPASIAGTTAELKVGVQDQKINDIVITEGVKESILKTYNTNYTGGTASPGNLTVTLTQNVEFAKEPTVTITEGNLEITKSAVAVAANVLTIPIKAESTSATKITISDILVTLDRTLPEGPIYAKLGGSALVENDGTATGEFDTATMCKTEVAKVVTPAPDKEVFNSSSFVIGAASFKVNGVEQTMDVAPYIKDSRTYMPIRYVAYAMGINDANILWDATNQTVTLMKGDKVVQLKVGSKVIVINGAAVTMDVAPEISNSRTMLPVSFVANAFGATASWDAATQTVSIK